MFLIVFFMKNARDSFSVVMIFYFTTNSSHSASLINKSGFSGLALTLSSIITPFLAILNAPFASHEVGYGAALLSSLGYCSNRLRESNLSSVEPIGEMITSLPSSSVFLICIIKSRIRNKEVQKV